jgi:hypothetical protein
MELGRARRKTLVEFQIAVLGHRALDLGVVEQAAVGVVVDGEELFAVDMDEEIVLAVEMERRRRVRRGHEQKALDLFEAGIS